MKIAIMGSGGIGAYYGGLLARAGNEVTFIARGAHLEAIRKNGLQIKSGYGDFLVKPAQATDNPLEIGPVELALVCVKTPATEQAAQAIRPLIAPQTAVMSLQNGIDAAERIGAVIGMEHMLGAATWISVAIEAPGVVRHFSQFRRIVFGELDGQTTCRAQAVLERLQGSRATAELSSDISKVLWTKFVFISAASAVGSLTRLEMGDYRAVPETRSLLIAIMREVEALARAQNIALDDDVVEKSLAFIDASAPSIKASMQRDIETGHVSELEAIIGVIGRKGRELGLPTPVSDIVYAALLPIDLKARQADSA
ncbi:MAG: ketopantoate reductase family protein [Chloroflexi bacterium]|nr:ketopantoate reductase family protein [Chloroflexota bacterium]